MKEATPAATVASVLIEWAQHEALGRYSFANEVPADLRAQLQDGNLRDEIERGTGLGVRVALDLLFQWRRPMLAMLFAAEPVAIAEVSISEENISRVGYLEHPDFADCELDDFARSLAARDEPLRGRIIAVASDPHGKIQLIDGLHRGRAWIEHWRLGRTSDPMPVSVIVTARRSWWEQTRTEAST